MLGLPRFDEVHVVSDLHLGGEPGRQIFRQGARLAATIRALAQRPAPRMALVLNGDIVDFLAQAPSRYFDAVGAQSKLEQIVHDPAFLPVFNALADFVAMTGRYLVLVLGNHDIELALPPVARWLVEWLARSNDAARGRIVLALDGVGWGACVGDRRLLCVHGNEVDDWNAVDFAGILAWSRALNGRRSNEPEITINAGTRMVIDVINEAKRKFPVADLLKPEVEAALPIMFALDPGAAVQLLDFAKIAGSKLRDRVRLAAGWLGGEEDGEEMSAQAQAQAIFERVVAPHLPNREPLAATGLNLNDAMFERAVGDLSGGYNATKAALLMQNSSEQLGSLADLATWAKRRLQGIEAPEAASEFWRSGLTRWLDGDRSFALDGPDPGFDLLDAQVDPDIDFLIVGHTHLRRRKPRKIGPGRWYLNSGTWIRLIELPPTVLADPRLFGAVFQAFALPSLSALDLFTLDLPNGPRPLVIDQPTVISVWSEHGIVRARVHEADADGALVLIA